MSPLEPEKVTSPPAYTDAELNARLDAAVKVSTRAAEEAKEAARAVQTLVQTATQPVPAGSRSGSPPQERVSAPSSDDTRRRSFQLMWVGGTLGSLFTMIAVSLPDAVRMYRMPPDWFHTFDVFLRYGYLVWLTAYFFVSHLLVSTSRAVACRDVIFDVAQSMLSLAAAWCLGFLSPADTLDRQPTARAILGANGAIATICLWSFLAFADRDVPTVNRYRCFGFGLAVASLGVWFPGVCSPRRALAISVTLFVLLSWVLWLYGSSRTRATRPGNA